MARTKKSAEQKQAELDAAYADAHAIVLHYLDEIGGRIHDLPAPESDGLNWAHVGDMNKIKNDLREIVEFVSGYSQ
jgi:hypothetical protein